MHEVGFHYMDPMHSTNIYFFFPTKETAAEVIGRLGGVQDVLSALRAFSDNADIASNCCNALWGLSVNGKVLSHCIWTFFE